MIEENGDIVLILDILVIILLGDVLINYKYLKNLFFFWILYLLCLCCIF